MGEMDQQLMASVPVTDETQRLAHRARVHELLEWAVVEHAETLAKLAGLFGDKIPEELLRECEEARRRVRAECT